MSSHPSEDLSPQTLIPSSTTASAADNNTSSNTSLPSDSSRRGTSGGRGQWRGRWRGRERGGRNISSEAGDAIGGLEKSQTSDKAKRPPRPRPTHFLALPLNDHPDLRNRVFAFQNALLGNTAEPSTSFEPTSNPLLSTMKRKGKPPPRISTVVEGLDTSIIIDPWRLHMTLGIMALEPDESLTSASEGTVVVPDVSASTNALDLTKLVTESLSCDSSKGGTTPKEAVTQPLRLERVRVAPASANTLRPPRKTIISALELLTSLKPSISDILSGSNGVEIPLEILNVFNTERMRVPNAKPSIISHVEDPNIAVEKGGIRKEEGADVGAGVLFLGSRQGQAQNGERRKLERVCELVYQTFKKEGYITDTKPLKLHCTILNASYRKPRRRIPFSYSDILASPACQLLGADPALPRTSESQGEQSVDTLTDNVRVLDQSAPDVKAAATTDTPVTEEKPKYRPPLKVPLPLPVALGTYRVREVQLWEMGSHGPNNEYVSHGGIVLE